MWPYQRHSFPTKYTREDQLLLAELDNNNERLSGKATVAIFKREYNLFGRSEYQRFNEYLNFHRPCGFATKAVDEKGKIKKQYNDYLTPFEKLQTLTKPEQFLKEGVTMESLKEVEQQRSDTESAKLMQEKKIVLFRSFSKPGILT